MISTGTVLVYVRSPGKTAELVGLAERLSINLQTAGRAHVLLAEAASSVTFSIKDFDASFLRPVVQVLDPPKTKPNYVERPYGRDYRKGFKR